MYLAISTYLSTINPYTLYII